MHSGIFSWKRRQSEVAPQKGEKEMHTITFVENGKAQTYQVEHFILVDTVRELRKDDKISQAWLDGKRRIASLL